VLHSLSKTPRSHSDVDVQIHLVGGEWSASRLGRFTSRETSPGTHWVGGWMGPRTGLDDVERRKSCPYRDSKSDPSAVQPVASRCTDSAFRIFVYPQKLNVYCGNSKATGRSIICPQKTAVGSALLLQFGRKYSFVHCMSLFKNPRNVNISFSLSYNYIVWAFKWISLFYFSSITYPFQYLLRNNRPIVFVGGKYCSM
jgi:hypothetical protein